MFYIVAPRFLKLFGSNIVAMALCPFILVRDRQSLQSRVLMQHEQIHIAQQIEMLIIPFYIAYLLFYIWYRLRGCRHHEAYMSIPFEREAYQYEGDHDYMDRRKLFAWL